MRSRATVQSPAAFDRQNLTRAGLRTRLADAGYRYQISLAETAAGLVDADLTFGFDPGDLRRYGALDNVATDLGAGKCATDIAFERATAQGNADADGAAPTFIPRGQWHILQTITPSILGMRGAGAKRARLISHGVHAITVPSNAGWDRPCVIFERFAIDSNDGTSCDARWAFYFPGVASGAAPAYNSGFYARDLAIGRHQRMGGAFYLKDVFDASIENIICTGLARMIQIVGSCVQCSFRRVRSFNDGGGTGLTRYGISTEIATYAGDTILTPENLTFTKCTVIRCGVGFQHTAGLLIRLEDFDCEADSRGMFLNAECTVTGGLISPSPTAADWTGVLRGVQPSNDDAATIIDGLDINCLNQPTLPGSSYGIDAGDGVSPVRGLVIRNCRIRGAAGSLDTGFRGRILNDVTFEDNFIRHSTLSGTFGVRILTSARVFLNRNRNDGGTWEVTDGGNPAAFGQITRNKISALSTTLTTLLNWDVMFNEAIAPTWRFPHVLYGSTTWDPPSLANQADVATTVTVAGAAVGDIAVATLSSIGAVSMLMFAEVQAADTVRVSMKNVDGATRDLGSGTLRVVVFRAP